LFVGTHILVAIFFSFFASPIHLHIRWKDRDGMGAKGAKGAKDAKDEQGGKIDKMLT